VQAPEKSGEEYWPPVIEGAARAWLILRMRGGDREAEMARFIEDLRGIPR